MLVKIRNKDGLFSKGGNAPYFTKKGKMWSSLGYVKSHIRQINEDKLKKVYKDCEIFLVDDNDNYKEEIINMDDFLAEFTESETIRENKKLLRLLKAKKQHAITTIARYNHELKALDKKIEELEYSKN
jgi:hypothetical protein